MNSFIAELDFSHYRKHPLISGPSLSPGLGISAREDNMSQDIAATWKINFNLLLLPVSQQEI